MFISPFFSLLGGLPKGPRYPSHFFCIQPPRFCLTRADGERPCQTPRICLSIGLLSIFAFSRNRLLPLPVHQKPPYFLPRVGAGVGLPPIEKMESPPAVNPPFPNNFHLMVRFFLPPPSVSWSPRHSGGNPDRGPPPPLRNLCPNVVFFCPPIRPAPPRFFSFVRGICPHPSTHINCNTNDRQIGTTGFASPPFFFVVCRGFPPPRTPDLFEMADSQRGPQSPHVGVSAAAFEKNRGGPDIFFPSALSGYVIKSADISPSPITRTIPDAFGTRWEGAPLNNTGGSESGLGCPPPPWIWRADFLRFCFFSFLFPKRLSLLGCALWAGNRIKHAPVRIHGFRPLGSPLRPPPPLSELPRPPPPFVKLSVVGTLFFCFKWSVVPFSFFPLTSCFCVIHIPRLRTLRTL